MDVMWFFILLYIIMMLPQENYLMLFPRTYVSFDFSQLHRFIFLKFQEIRELIVELLEEKQFLITDLSQEYSKTKATDIIGLDDQVTNYNDPKFFSFEIRW